MSEGRLQSLQKARDKGGRPQQPNHSQNENE